MSRSGLRRALHVEHWGDPGGPRVVWLHGITGHGRAAEAVARAWLADRHVIAPDLLGHGSSPWEPPWTIEEHLDTLVETVGLEASAWVGHSFGGRLAFELAARHPEAVDRLVLLDPALRIDPTLALHAAESDLCDRSYASFEDGVTRRFEESGVLRAARDTVAAELAGFLVEDADGRWRYRYSRASVIAAKGEMASPPPPFETVQVPTLVVLAADSYLDYGPFLDAHRAALGGLLEVVTVPGGHTVLWDAPEETGAAVAAFLGPRP